MRARKANTEPKKLPLPAELVPAPAPSQEPSVEESSYCVAFEFAPDCQVLTDVQGVIVNLNHAGTRFLQMEKSFLLGKPLGLMFRSKTRSPFYDGLARLVHGLPTCFFETKLNFPRWHARRVRFATVDTPRTIRWIIQDTTPHQEAEAAPRIPGATTDYLAGKRTPQASSRFAR